MSKWCGDENCLQCVDKEPDPYVHLPREDYDAIRAENQRLRGVIAELVGALPVVKGDVVIEPPWVGQVGGTYDVRVRQQVNNTMTSVRIAQFHIKEDAEAFAALLTHRAWMNYATLAAQDAGQGGLQ